MNKVSLIAIVSILIIYNLSGQELRPSFQLIHQGLSNNSVHCIIKDRKGFLWIGTQEGLNKYDGNSFVIYENNPQDSTSISQNAINDILEDSKGNIWIGTSNGLNLYNRDKDNFIRIMIRSDNVCISSICEDRENNIWLGTVGIGVVFYSPENQEMITYLHDESVPSSIASDYVNSVLTDCNNNLWIGTWNGLDRLNKKDSGFCHFTHDPLNPQSISSNVISSLATDKSGNIWIGTYEGGLNKLIETGETVTFKKYLSPNRTCASSENNSVLSLFVDNEDHLWIGTENRGLNCLNTVTDQYLKFQYNESNQNSPVIQSIVAIYTDENDILWVGTYKKGIYYWDKKYQKFESFKKNIYSDNALNADDVTGFVEDSRGNIWIATDGGGIMLFNPKTNRFKKVVNLTSNAVMTIIYDSENIWAGTWNGGIDVINSEGIKIKNYKVEGVVETGNNKIISLYRDKQNNIWAGTNGSGLFLYSHEKDRFIQISDKQIPSQLPEAIYVTGIMEDSQNNIWVTTLYGLKLLKRKPDNSFFFTGFYPDNRETSISSYKITVVYEDSQKNLWFGTEDKGLNLYNRQDSSFVKFEKEDGLPNNSVKGILEDNKGNLWISTNKGISEFDPSKKIFKNYIKEDGLNSDEFYINSCLKTKSGYFYFGSNNGFNIFNPDSIKENKIIPPVYLTDLKIFNKSAKIGAKGSPLTSHISQTKKIVLTHLQTSFTVEYVAINYTQSSKNQYAYILDGLENSWNYVGNKTSATYTYVKPGTYTFRVKGSNNDGVWNETPATLKIIVLPPYWKTVWAYFIYIAILLSLLFSFVRLLMERAKQAHILKLERIQREKDEELNKLKMQFFTNISHELRTPLTLILSPLENIISTTRQNQALTNQLNLIYKSADRLYRLVNELMYFTKSEDNKLNISPQRGNIIKFIQEVFQFYNDIAQRRQIDYQFIAGTELIEAWFDTDKLEKIVLNLLSNSFKFTPDNGKIVVKIEKTATLDRESEKKCNHGYVKISVTDNGRGISDKDIDKVFDRFFQSPDESDINQAGTGIGLALAKSLVELHCGVITVKSEKWKGTSFSVFLPLGCNHFADIDLINEPVDIDVNISTFSVKPTKGKTNPEKCLANAHVILIVEDNYELRKYIVSMLSCKYNMLEADNGKTGFDLAVEHSPDLIISDIIMNKMTGTELCKKIKEEFNTSHIPVILLTAKTTIEEQIEGIETGADAYITKPFNFPYLEITIKKLIETRQKLFQRYSQDVYILPKEMCNNQQDQNFLERAIEFIDKNILNENLSAEELSSHLLLSHSQTYRKIKNLTGQSVTEFIKTIRLKRAIKYFESGEYNVSEVAYKVGFNSPAYFTKCFRDQFGKSPSAYFSTFKNSNY